MAEEKEVNEYVAALEQNGSRRSKDDLYYVLRDSNTTLYEFMTRHYDVCQELLGAHTLLKQAAQDLEARAKSFYSVIAYLGPAPAHLSPEGVLAAFVDLGGQRAVRPLAEGLAFEDLAQSPMVYMDPMGVVASPASECEPPTEIARVAEISGENAVVDIQAGDQLCMRISLGLAGKLKVGDRVLIDKAHGLLTGVLASRDSMSEWSMDSAPKERFKDIGGQGSVIESVRERVFYPLLHPEALKAMGMRMTSGVLLHGKTGCGKTLLGRAIAGELHDMCGADSVFLRVKGGALKSMWYGQTTQRVIQLWKHARTLAREGKIVVLFLDEADSLGHSRGGGGYDYGHSADQDAINAWLSEMDGLDTDEADKIVCIASTNLPKALDAAFISRFDVSLGVNRPDAEGAKAIFKVHLSPTIPLESDYNASINSAVDFLYDQSALPVARAQVHGMAQPEKIHRYDLVSGRLIRDVVSGAKWMAIRECAGKVGKKAKPVLKESHLVESAKNQVSELLGKLTEVNLPQFVDSPVLQKAPVTQLVVAKV